jgi:hypothetical protein
MLKKPRIKFVRNPGHEVDSHRLDLASLQWRKRPKHLIGTGTLVSQE